MTDDEDDENDQHDAHVRAWENELVNEHYQELLDIWNGIK